MIPLTDKWTKEHNSHPLTEPLLNQTNIKENRDKFVSTNGE